jgi:energy-converting hydrogenase Eha subunit C
MNKIISLVLLVGGIVLIVYGASASDSIGSSFSRFFTGSPTDKTIWMLIGGGAAAIVGAAGLVLRGSKSP